MGVASYKIEIIKPSQVAESLAPSPVLLLTHSVMSKESYNGVSVSPARQIAAQSYVYQVQGVAASYAVTNQPKSERIAAKELMLEE